MVATVTLSNDEKQASIFVSSPGPGDLSIRVCKSLDEVFAVRDICTAWPGHRDSDFDVSQRVVWTWKEVLRPHVIVLYRNGAPDAVLVGRIENTRIDARVGYLRVPGLSATPL